MVLRPARRRLTCDLQHACLSPPTERRDATSCAHSQGAHVRPFLPLTLPPQAPPHHCAPNCACCERRQKPGGRRCTARRSISSPHPPPRPLERACRRCCPPRASVCLEPRSYNFQLPGAAIPAPPCAALSPPSAHIARTTTTAPRDAAGGVGAAPSAAHARPTLLKVTRVAPCYSNCSREPPRRPAPRLPRDAPHARTRSALSHPPYPSAQIHGCGSGVAAAASVLC